MIMKNTKKLSLKDLIFDDVQAKIRISINNSREEVRRDMLNKQIKKEVVPLRYTTEYLFYHLVNQQNRLLAQ